MRYTVTLEVECTPQDDLVHFQPDTVNARLVDTDIVVVGSYDAEAVRMLLRFVAQGIFNDKAADIVRAASIAKATQ